MRTSRLSCMQGDPPESSIMAPVGQIAMNFRELEERLRSLIEVHLISVLPGQRPEDLLVQRITAAMEASATASEGGRLTAPNVYTLLAHPDSVAYWKNSELLAALVEVLESAAQQGNIHFDVSPSISIAEDPAIAPGDFSLIASYRARSLAETKDMKTDIDNAEEQEDF